MHANPRVRETLCVCELLLSAWTETREAVMPKLDALMTQQQTARFDATALLYFFEVGPVCKRKIIKIWGQLVILWWPQDHFYV